MNRPPRYDPAPPFAATQHAAWLREEIEALRDAVFLAHAGIPVHNAEIARLESEIGDREEVIERYRSFGLLP
jgi:hypothetical protein